MTSLDHALAHPLLQSSLAALAGLGLLAWRRWRSAILLLAAALLWAWLCATPAFSYWLQHSLADQYPARPATTLPTVDAILVVGGGTLPRHWPAWDADTDPALTTPIGYALALYHAGKAPHIILSTAPGDGQIIATVLQRQGVPQQALMIAPPSYNTRQDALHAMPVLQRLHARRILLVTYGRHMPRTLASFASQGMAATPAAAFEPVRSTPSGVAGYRYSKGALYLSTACLHEYLGLLYYRLRGWAAW